MIVMFLPAQTCPRSHQLPRPTEVARWKPIFELPEASDHA